MHLSNGICLKYRGLYCPLIPARIQRNPGNSQNSRGINFGTGTCQSDKTILVECWTEFKFCRNGSGNHMDGMHTEHRMTRNGIHPTTDTQIECWHLPTPNLGVIYDYFLLPQPPPPPPSTTPIHHCLLTTITSSPLSHPCHHHHWPPPSTSVTHNHHNANDVATPCHPVNDDQPWVHDGIQGVMSLSATWQTMNNDIVVVRCLYPK